MWKKADKMLEKIGFHKVAEGNTYVEYEKFEPEFNYTHKIVIQHKFNGPAIVQSYDPELFDVKRIGNTCVGMTAAESKAVLRKMKELRWS